MASTSYPKTRQDWPGRFIANLAEALAHRDDVQLDLWAPPGETSDAITAVALADEAAWLDQLIQVGGIAHLLRTTPLTGLAKGIGLLRRLHNVYQRSQDTDVIHVNWLQNALALWRINKPAVISVLGSDFGLLRLPGMVTALRTVFRNRRVILTPNADWMADELGRQFGDLTEIRSIPFGVDKPWFEIQRKPSQSIPARWLTVTRLTQNKVGDLFEWGEGLFGTDRQLHLFGPMQEQMPLPGWVHYHGSTHPHALLNEWFPHATGLVTLSRHDEGRPQVMLEAMAAGLPVIASRLPAHNDLIQSGSTGVLVESQSAFATALRELEKSDINQHVGHTAREWIQTTIGTWDDCAARYHAAYLAVLNKNK